VSITKGVGVEHRSKDTLAALDVFAMILRHQSTWVDSKTLIGKVSFRSRGPNKQHPETLGKLSKCARVLQKQGKYIAESEAMHDQAVGGHAHVMAKKTVTL
jgi:hypothetical protein